MRMRTRMFALRWPSNSRGLAGTLEEVVHHPLVSFVLFRLSPDEAVGGCASRRYEEWLLAKTLGSVFGGAFCDELSAEARCKRRSPGRATPHASQEGTHVSFRV